MDSFDKTVASVLGGVILAFLIGSTIAMSYNQTCRLKAIEAKIPSAEIAQLCK